MVSGNASVRSREDDVLKPHPLGLTGALREPRPLEEVNEAVDDVLQARNKEPRVAVARSDHGQ